MRKPPRDEKPAPLGPTRAHGRAHHRILGLEVTDGFLKGTRLEFADGLNCIIGGRGTGKTTVVELIRYALGLMPDSRVHATRARSIQNLLQQNLGGGRIQLDVQTKHGARYTAERLWNDAAEVKDECGARTNLALDRDLIFKADIYSQNEIEEIATSPALQLALVDKFAEEEIRRVEADARKVIRDLEHNATELSRLDRETRDLEETAIEAAALEERIRALDPPAKNGAERLREAFVQRTARESERLALEALRDEIGRLASDVESSLCARARRLGARIEPHLLDGRNSPVFCAAAEQVSQIGAAFEDAAARLRSACESASTALSDQARLLNESHARDELVQREALAGSQENRSHALERTELERRYLEVIAAKKKLEMREQERRALEEQRRALTKRLSELRDERFRVRKGVAERLTAALAPTVRVSLKQAASRSAYRDLLNDALKGSGFRYATIVDRILESMSPDELSALVRSGQTARLSALAGIDDERARRVVDLLRANGLAYTIGTLELEDLPRIELLDGEVYKDSANLSTGQRCTAILPILLLESERPLLIDEPEGNLDNAYIYETVVKRLLATKSNRQLIFVTHNPNIPVLGDAERVFVVSSDGKVGSVKRQGSVDELKAEIETLLEGGREAFLLRKKRYGH